MHTNEVFLIPCAFYMGMKNRMGVSSAIMHIKNDEKALSHIIIE